MISFIKLRLLFYILFYVIILPVFVDASVYLLYDFTLQFAFYIAGRKISGEDILHPDNLVIVADGCNIGWSYDPVLGVSLLMAVYWMYGFEYPNVLKKIF